MLVRFGGVNPADIKAERDTYSTKLDKIFYLILILKKKLFMGNW